MDHGTQLLQNVFQRVLDKYKETRLERHLSFIVKFLEQVQLDVEQKDHIVQVSCTRCVHLTEC